MAGLLEHWARLAVELEPRLSPDSPSPVPASGRVGAPFDLACHLHDVRHALNRPGDRDAPTTRIAFALSRSWLGMRLRSAALPALRLRAQDAEWVVGDGNPAATVAGERFELFPAVTGRRAAVQLLALQWEGAAARYVDVLSPYPLPSAPVTE